jgi:hypothetical protein
MLLNLGELNGTDISERNSPKSEIETHREEVDVIAKELDMNFILEIMD